MEQYLNKCVDLVLTDPPYGLNKKIHDGGTWAKNEKYNNVLLWDYKIEDSYFEEIFRISKNQIIWGGNYYTNILPISRCWLAWIKPHFPTMSEIDLAWTSFNKPSKFFHFSRVNPSIHPTQKPVELMKWCLENYSKENDLIFDPFLGSGTTAVACKQLKRNFIGVEKMPEYCKIAQERLDKTTLPML